MAQLREIKKRIKSIESTKKVTHAMELVAAAKMRKSQMAALSARPYSTNLHTILNKIRSQSEVAHKLLKANKAEKEMIILITSDRGLAGGLNINIFREILKNEPKNASFVAVGKKAIQFSSKMNFDLVASFGSEEIPYLDLARRLAKISIDSFLKKEVSKVTITYPHFESTVNQVPKSVQILPIKPEIDNDNGPHPRGEVKESPGKHPGGVADTLFEPTTAEIVDVILPHHVLTAIYQALLEAKASEHSARMVAMKNATDAAGDLIDDLTLTYNQARQEAITTELLDIVTAQRAFQ